MTTGDLQDAIWITKERTEEMMMDGEMIGEDNSGYVPFQGYTMKSALTVSLT